jgi:hypothetical protein
VVTIIDVYPDAVAAQPALGGYQLMVSADIFRGRYRATPLLYRLALPTANHVFLPGTGVRCRFNRAVTVGFDYYGLTDISSNRNNTPVAEDCLMPAIELGFVATAAALALASLGGGLYEFLVVDPFWPRRPDLIQPQRGGISRRRFWIPAHTAFELLLIASLVVTWGQAATRTALLIALVSHAAMRIQAQSPNRPRGDGVAAAGAGYRSTW